MNGELTAADTAAVIGIWACIILLAGMMVISARWRGKRRQPTRRVVTSPDNDLTPLTNGPATQKERTAQAIYDANSERIAQAAQKVADRQRHDQAADGLLAERGYKVSNLRGR